MEEGKKPVKEPTPAPAGNDASEQLIARMEETTRKLEAANAKLEASRVRAEAERVSNLLAGESEAGQEPTKPTAEEKLKKEIQAWMPKELLPLVFR